jgi:FkbM family methyltransferase
VLKAISTTGRTMCRGLATLAACSPGSDRAIRLAALLPAPLKSTIVYRGLAAIASRLRNPDTLVDTNLGISDKFRVRLPLRKSLLIFGRPTNHIAERATLELAAHCAGQSACFLDVGANEGMFTFFVASAVGRDRPAFLHVFEPDDELYDRLDRNLERNGIAAKLNKLAIGEHSGKQVFHRNLDDDLSGSLSDYFASTHRTVAVEISVTTLADYLQAHDLRRACIKVDAEGAGLAVWEGMRAVLDRIDWLIFEILQPEAEGNLVGRMIEEGNWSAYYIRDFELVHSRYGEYEYHPPFYNWLFCRHRPPALGRLVAGTPFSVIETVTPAHS